MKKKDDICVIVTAALAEGLSYGKYMAKYNYDPPCLKSLSEGNYGGDNGKETTQKEQPKEILKVCPQCGKEFLTIRRIYCSTDCQQEHNAEYNKRAYIKRKLERGDRYCVMCMKVIPVERRASAKTCSDKCSEWMKKKRWSEYGLRKY